MAKAASVVWPISHLVLGYLASCLPVRPAETDRTREHKAAYEKVLGGCGLAAVLGGVLFVVWGYLDTPGVSGGLKLAVRMLSFVVPGLFLAGEAGLGVLAVRRIGVLGWVGWTGLAIALVGAALGVVDGIAEGDPVRALFVRRGWPLYLTVWLVPLLTGFAIMGVATVLSKPLRTLGMVALAVGLCGWGYYLTDSEAVFEARAIHVGCGLLFGSAWVAWGVALRARRARYDRNTSRRHRPTNGRKG
jgi:hypothetical protein